MPPEMGKQAKVGKFKWHANRNNVFTNNLKPSKLLKLRPAVAVADIVQ